MCAYQGVRNVSFSENFANILYEWPLRTQTVIETNSRKVTLFDTDLVITFTNSFYATWRISAKYITQLTGDTIIGFPSKRNSEIFDKP